MSANLVNPEKRQKIVRLDIGYGLIETVTVNSDTGLLFDLSEDIGNDQTIKISDILPQASDSSLTLYLYVVRGRDTSNVFIVDRPTMVECLNIYSLTGDLNFLQFIVNSLFKFWTVLSPVLYSSSSSRVPEEVR